jgi:hypothetical protein
MAELAGGALQPGKKPAIGLDEFANWFEVNVLPKRRGRERELETLRRLVKFFGSPRRQSDACSPKTRKPGF